MEDQSEGFPLRDILSLRALGDWAWPAHQNCRRAAAVAAVVGVNFLNVRFSKEKLQKSMF